MARDQNRPFISSQQSVAGVRARQPTTAELVEANRGPGIVAIAFRTLIGIAAFLLVLFVLFLVATAIQGDDTIPPAPWAQQSAPAVTPGPLGVQ